VAWYRPDLVNGAEAHFALDSGWAGELRELSEEAVDRSAASDDLHSLGTCELAAWAGADNDVTPSRRRLFRQSNSRPK
jgi:hypothetical protein